jgi:hypothetical protein
MKTVKSITRKSAEVINRNPFSMVLEDEYSENAGLSDIEEEEERALRIIDLKGNTVLDATFKLSQSLGCSILEFCDFGQYGEVKTPKVLEATLVKYTSGIIDNFIAQITQTNEKKILCKTLIATTASTQEVWEKIFKACKSIVAVKKFSNKGTGNIVTIWMSNN